MELIIGARRITPSAIHRIKGGVTATLRGEALMSLLNASFHGTGSIEMLGGDLDRHPMEVTSIEMTGADTTVTLLCAGPAKTLM